LSKEIPIGQRLLKGAYILGLHWRKLNQCEKAWSQYCECQPKTAFCKAKLQWLKLISMEIARGAERHIPDDNAEFFIIETMKISELKKTGLNALIDLADGGRMKFGQKGRLHGGQPLEGPSS